MTILFAYAVGCAVAYPVVRWMRVQLYLGKYEKSHWYAYMVATWPMMILGLCVYYACKLAGKAEYLSMFVQSKYDGMRALEKSEKDKIAGGGLVVGVCKHYTGLCDGLMIRDGGDSVAYCNKCGCHTHTSCWRTEEESFQ